MTTLTAGAAVLRAVLDEPDDDLHRLAYADWLEERGGPGDADRAEFIRVQLEMAKGEPCVAEKRGDPKTFPGHGCRRCHLARREAILLETHERSWVRQVLPDRVDVQRAWGRGFLEIIWLPCADFVAHAGALFAAQPVARVTLTDKAPLPAYSSVGVGAPITGWGWGPERDDYANAGVPAPLYPLLTGFWPRERAWKVYPGQPDALAALSAACLLYGRDEARRRRT